MASVEQVLHAILQYGVDVGASDVHLKVAEPPMYRVDGSLRVKPDTVPLKPDDTRALGSALLSSSGFSFKVDQVREFDFAYSVPQLGRFRVNLFRTRGSFAIIVRIIPHRVPSLQNLEVPPILQSLALVNRGLILVTGAAGSGKSTTLAGMIDHINRSRRCHILTIEDPIEYLHGNHQASISQREVGTDTQSFVTAFRGALRQDPDVILVGEMRDAESMEMALKAAETGHLVLSTLHTTDTPKSINRILAFFPPESQLEVRGRLADALAAIVCQRLVPRSDHKGRIAACEILVATNAIRDCIREPDKQANIRELQEEGDGYGMQTFDQHIIKLYQSNVLDLDTARQAATSASNFDRLVGLMEAEKDVARSAAKRGGTPTGGSHDSGDIPGFERGSNLYDDEPGGGHM